MKRVFYAVMMGAGLMGARTRGESFRTDINPALTYYRALLVAPKWSAEDNNYITTNDWRTKKLDERFNRIIGQLHNEFMFVGRAAKATVPCDWGVDLTDGPETLLPSLAPLKQVAVMTRLRVRWHLENRRESEACDELTAAMALGRNCSRDGTVIACLVQIAIENIVCTTIAENYGHFSNEALQRLEAGIEAAPVRGTMVDTIPIERSMFVGGWLQRKVGEIRAMHPGDEPAAWREALSLLDRVTDDSGDEHGADQPSHATQMKGIAEAANGNTTGLLKLADDLNPFYDRLAELMRLPYASYGPAMDAYMSDVQKSTNPLLHLWVPALQKCRPREFTAMARLAMVRAAVEYRLHGMDGLKAVNDPNAEGPLKFEEFSVEGKHRGFKLTSKFESPSPNSLIFVEKEGPPFYLDGPKQGQLLTELPVKN